MNGCLPNVWPTLSSALEGARLRVMSFGAGVQSTTMMVMAQEGLIVPMPDIGIFVDPEDEHVIGDIRGKERRRAPVRVVSDYDVLGGRY